MICTFCHEREATIFIMKDSQPLCDVCHDILAAYAQSLVEQDQDVSLSKVKKRVRVSQEGKRK